MLITESSRQDNDKAIAVCEELLNSFPTSHFLRAQTAIALYNLRGLSLVLSRICSDPTTDFDGAEQIFEELFNEDQVRLDNLDIYSNILYVKEDRVKLSALAHHAQQADKYRPETCCIIGSFSLFSCRLYYFRKSGAFYDTVTRHSSCLFLFFFFFNMFIPRIDISLPISLVISLFLIQCR